MKIYNINIDIQTTPEVFGNGCHETTRFLLYFLSQIDLTNKIVIDAGCGTGILSIFASKRDAETIWAIDYSIEAIQQAKKNIENNNISNIILIHSDINDIQNICGNIVVANFPKEHIFYNLLTLEKIMPPDGILITTFYKELPEKDLIKRFEVLDCIEGTHYDCYMLKKKQ